MEKEKNTEKQIENAQVKKIGRMKRKTIVAWTITLMLCISLLVLGQKVHDRFTNMDQEIHISMNAEIKRMTDADAAYLINNQMTHDSGQYLLEYASYYLSTFGINVGNMNALGPKTPVNLYYTALDEDGNLFRTIAASDSSPLTLNAKEMVQLFRNSQYEQLDSEGDTCYFRSHKLGRGYVIVSYWIEDFGKTALDAGTPYIANADGMLLWIDETNTIISSNREECVGQSLEQVFSSKISKEGRFAKSYKNGLGFYEFEKVGARTLLVFLPLRGIAGEIIWGTVVPIVLFWIVVLFILGYILKIAKEKQVIGDDSESRCVRFFKSIYLDRDMVSHIVSLAVFGCLLLGLTIFYVSSLISYSSQNIDAAENLNGISEAYNTSQINREKTEADVKKEFLDYADIVAWGIMTNNQKVDDHTLNSMVNMVSMMKDVKITDGTATITASTTNEDGYTLGRNDSSINSLCWQIMDGEIDNALYGKGVNANGSYDMSLLVRRQDAKGVIIIDMSVDKLPDYVDSWSLEETMLTADMGNAITIALHTDNPDTIYMITPNANRVERLNTALPEKIMENGYAGPQRINGIKCYVNSLLNTDYGVLFISALPLKDFPSTGTFKIFLQIVLGMILFVLLLFWGVARVEISGEESKEIAANKLTDFEDESLIEEARRRFFDIEKYVNEGFKSVITRMIIANGSLLFLLLFLDYMFEKKPLLAYLLGSQWNKGLNLFSVTMILLVLVGCSLFGFLLNKISMMIFTNMGPRGMTIGQLLNSISRFIIFVVAIIWSLKLIGCNLSALLTGAGIVGAAISLCANSTINDLLAGFFIVFEGSFKIGDWVKVGEWRGQVLEIGMRTTKIACSDCVKILNNATMTNVTVMDYCNSGALVAIDIAYKEDAEKVMELLNANRPKYRAAIPEIEEGPFVKGITKLGDSGVTIEMYALGKQEKIAKIERDIRLQTKKLFDEHGIEIPFNQVTIHQAEEKH